jgi:type II secretory pathway pseudopilin PulG
MNARFEGHVKEAFTLVELFVTLVIIIGLAALLLPAYHRVVEKTNVGKDLNNLRQIGLAMNLYQNEHGYFPGDQWPSVLVAQTTSISSVLKSPFDKRATHPVTQAAPVSYDININLWGVDVLRIAAPSSCIFLAPLTNDTASIQFTSTDLNPSLPAPLSRTSNGAGASGGTCLNRTHLPVLFADLHSEIVSMSAFHSPLPDPNTAHAISDLRWNE